MKTDSIEIDVQLNQEDIERGGRIVSKANLSKSEYWTLQIAWLVVAALVLWPLITQNRALLPYSWGAIAMFFAFWTINGFQANTRMKRVWRETRAWHSPILLQLSKASVHWNSTYVKEEFLWDSFKMAVETEGYFVLTLTTGAFITVPKRHLKEISEINEIRELLKNELGKKFIASQEK
jgi:hypothetical protein